MTGNLEQLDPNYVVSFDYSKENVAKLVSELEGRGLQTITRPGHNSKTVYAFTRVDEPGTLESGEAFTEKHPHKQQPQQPQQPQQKQQQQQLEKEPSAGFQEKKSLVKPEDEKLESDFGPAPTDTADVTGDDDKKKQGFMSKAQDSAKGVSSSVQDQGGVQGLKDKAAKVPGGEKAEGDLKKKIPGGAGGKLGGLGGAVGGAAGAGSGGDKKGLADQAKGGGLKGFNKDDIVKGSQDVFSGHKDQLMDAGKQAAQGDTSGLQNAGKDIAKDVSGRVDKDQLMDSGKKAFSGNKKDLLKNGKEGLAKKQAESQGKDMLSGVSGKGGDAGGVAGVAGAAGGAFGKSGKDAGRSKKAPDGNASGFEDDTRGALGGSGLGQNGFKKDADLSQNNPEVDTMGAAESSIGSNAAVKGFSRGTSSSPMTRSGEKAAPSTGEGSKNPFEGAAKKEESSAFSGAAKKDNFSGSSGIAPSSGGSGSIAGGGRATLLSIVANFDFVHSVTPIYDIEKRKKLEATVNNLVQAPVLTPSDNELTNLEHLTRNPREILYFFYFKNYIRWLLPISLVGVICRLFSRAVAPWEFNITYTSLLVAWSLLFTSSWIFYFEPLYANKLGKVLGGVAPSDKKLSSPHVVLYKKFAFVPVALLFAASLIGFQFLCFFIEIFLTQLYSGPFSAILALLPTVLISAIVPVLTFVYNKLFVDPLVQWENGPDPKKSKTQKNYILTFLTSYVPLFITLFVYLPLGYKFTPDLQNGVATYAQRFHIPVIASEFIVDINRYKKQFFYYTVTAQIMNMIMENALPLVLDAVLPSLIKDGNRSQGDVVAKIDSVVQSRYPGDFDLWKKVQLFHSSNYGEFDVDQNYSKLVVQFGYIAMFSIIWPLAPLIFTIFDLIIFRADLWRAFIKSKPSSDPTDLQVAKGGAHKVHASAAPWNGILEKTTYLGSIVSVTLLLMYRYSNLPGVGLANSLEKRGNWHKESPLVFSWPKILLAAVAVEHLVLLGYVYAKEICLSYQTKFEHAVLPSVKLQAEPTYNEEVDETAAVMDEVAYEPVEQPKPKDEDSKKQDSYADKDVSSKLDNTDNVSSGARSTGAEVYGDGGYSYDYDGGYAPHGGRDAAESIPGLSGNSGSYGQGTSYGGYSKDPSFDAGYKDGYAKGSGADYEGSSASGFDDGYSRHASSIGSKRRGFGKSGEPDDFNDDLSAGAVGGLGAGGAAEAGPVRKTGSSTRSANGDINGTGISGNGSRVPGDGVSRSRSTKRSGAHAGSSSGEKSRPSERGLKESGRQTTSTKETNLSPQGNGKGYSSAPQVVADSGSREIPLQSQGKHDLNAAANSGSSAPRSSKNLGVAGGAGAGAGLGAAAGAAGDTGVAHSDRSSSTRQRSNRESSYLESPTSGGDAGATVPEPIPTSRNHGSRYNRSGDRAKSYSQSVSDPSASYGSDKVNDTDTATGVAAGSAAGGTAGGLGGVAAGAGRDLKSGKVPKGSGDVGKDLQKDASSGLKSGKLPNDGDVGKGLQKDIPKDFPSDIGSGLPSGGKSPTGGKDALGSFSDVAQQGGKDTGKGQSVSEAMKTLDPAAVAGSAGNIAKDPASAPQELGNLAQQGAPVASAAWANRSKGAKRATKGVDDSAASPSSAGGRGFPRGAEDSAAGPDSVDKQGFPRGAVNDDDLGAGVPQGGRGVSASRDAGGYGAGGHAYGARAYGADAYGADGGSYGHKRAPGYGSPGYSSPGYGTQEDSYGADQGTYGRGTYSGANRGTGFADDEAYDSQKYPGGGRNAGGSYGAGDYGYDTEQPAYGTGAGTAGAGESRYVDAGDAGPESPAAQQFGRDVHSFKSGGTFGTAESKIDNLTGGGGTSEGVVGTGAGAGAGVGAGAGSAYGVQKSPQRSGTKPKGDATYPKTSSSKSGAPSRSKTIGHSSHAKKEPSAPKTTNTSEAERGTSAKGPKERSSNPELRNNQANSSHEGKSKHKSSLLHRIIKKLE